MMGMILIMLMVVRMASASAPSTKMDLKPGPELSKPSSCSWYQMRVEVPEMTLNISKIVTYLEIKRKSIREIPSGAFVNFKNLTKLHILENSMLQTIGPCAFANVPHLRYILISEHVALTTIGPFAFSSLPKLTEIFITKSIQLTDIHPDAFTDIPQLRFFNLEDNSHIEKVPANAFRGLCAQTIMEIRLTRNGIKEVASDAFNGTKMRRLDLKGNQELSYIHPNAFVGSRELVDLLDVSQTALSSLPHSILGGLETLIAESAFHLKELPPLRLFTKLSSANLTYPSHCCAFNNTNSNGSKWNLMCAHPEAKDNHPFYEENCINSTSVTCRPVSDEFNPCEDIMKMRPLRVLIWIISILALLGNTLVLFVLLGSHSKMTVPRFLMCHLAFADLCMGIYLLVIAAVDTLTRGIYYNHAMVWQMGLGCNAAGFFTVFASELSVFTLTAITVERWHTITHALRLDRKLRLRHACIIMTAGWIFSLLAALLPTVGVSSYSKVSICLPMDVESLMSQIYVLSLLLLNILAFFCICGCYLSIYLTYRKPSSAPAHADTRVAQRMAILIFTNFVCMAPIFFFAISAALKLPLISVSDSKILLVLFYPINSCANPFLYAFFTRKFRRDFFILSARFGLFKTWAQIYRTESSLCQHPVWMSPKTSRLMASSLANTMSSDGRQGY
ncbi:follicle-stimulating hormone receptor isoform X2 [Gouania willdenowi]|uniref:follicle-stimulating hormone receptor isoform X2 n=1 Tax=Gouania willdenowi TaxID=441366 RepID=UPI0010557C6C|nr:lutropin-choriogonadotropic hormone receptor-like isoform X2 [Gouania willdenowi]